MKQNYRNTDPETSMVAGEAITKSGKRKTQCDRIYGVIKMFGPIGASDIAKIMHFPHPNPVHKRVSDLINAGLVLEAGVDMTNPKRPGRKYEVNPDPNPQPVEKTFKPCKKTIADIRAWAKKTDKEVGNTSRRWAIEAYCKDRGIE